jgi:hypothetical protein
MPESTHEQFVREALIEVRDGQARLAADFLRLFPRVEALEWTSSRYERIQGAHDNEIARLGKVTANHEGRIGHLEKPSARDGNSLPPVSTMAKVGPSGNYHLTKEVWAGIEQNIQGLHTELAELRKERDLETARAEGAETAIAQLRKDAEDAQVLAKHKRDRLLFALAILSAVLGLIGWAIGHVR